MTLQTITLYDPSNYNPLWPFRLWPFTDYNPLWLFPDYNPLYPFIVPIIVFKLEFNKRTNKIRTALMWLIIIKGHNYIYLVGGEVSPCWVGEWERLEGVYIAVQVTTWCHDNGPCTEHVYTPAQINLWTLRVSCPYFHEFILLFFNYLKKNICFVLFV